jgi:hypothetical protein
MGMDKESPDLLNSINELVRTNRILVSQQSYWRAFGRGIITGLGASVGAVLILAFAGSILRHLVTVDFIRPAVEAVLPYIESSVIVRPGAADEDLPAATFASPSPLPTPTPSPSVSPDLESTE